MSNYVKCLYCKETFDRDKIEYVKVKKYRYVHKKCFEAYDKIEQEKNEHKKLEEYVSSILGEDCDASVIIRIRSQIKNYKEKYGYTYSGMYKTLVYYYDVKGKPKNEIINKGVGILPYIYQDAKNYYYKLEQIKNNNKDKDINWYKQLKSKDIEIFSPEVKLDKKIKLFNLD